MKRYIVTGDLHVWLRKDVPEEWQIARYEALFDELAFLCLDESASLILAGDVFEKAKPTLGEIKLVMEFFRLLKSKEITVYLISGNHENISKHVDTFQFLDIGKDKTIDVNYRPCNWEVNVGEDTSLTFMSHCNLDADHYPVLPVKQHILISHFRCTVNQFIQEEIDVAKLSSHYDLVVAGDIHHALNFNNVWYTNAPVNKEFESNPDTGVVLLTLNNGIYSIKRIPTNLPKLIKRECTIEEYSAPKADDPNFYHAIITGAAQELRVLSVEQSQVKLTPRPLIAESLAEVREEETTLKDISFEEEMVGYLQELKYSDSRVVKMMNVLKETP